MSDEGKRWYGCEGCGRIGTSPRDLLRQGCEGKPEPLVPATELDRLEAEVFAQESGRKKACEDRDKAEARVRELGGALEAADTLFQWVQEHHPKVLVEAPTDIMRPLRRAALNAPVEDGRT